MNEPILLEEILSACSDVTEDAVYRRIRSALARGALVKKQRGVYFLPAREGATPDDISDESVLVKKYLSCGDEVYGYVVGDALRREVGLPAQDDSVIEIVTNREKSRCRSIGAHAVYRDVVLRAVVHVPVARPRWLPPSQRVLLPRENLQEAARSRGFGSFGLKPLERGWDAGASPGWRSPAWSRRRDMSPAVASAGALCAVREGKPPRRTFASRISPNLNRNRPPRGRKARIARS